MFMIDFGIIAKYFPDKGFGFITQTFSSDKQKEVFFHIKKVKRTHNDLAKKLDLGNLDEPIGCWYEIELTQKGEQVRHFLRVDQIHTKAATELPYFKDKLEGIWMNVERSIPVWLCTVSVDLVGVNRTKELQSEREIVIFREQEAEEKRRREQEVLLKIQEEEEKKRREDRERLRLKQEEERKKLEEERNRLNEIKDNEFEELVAEMKPKGFTHSKQVSHYIMRHRLGEKFKHISGIVVMEQGGDRWNFNGGFPPDVYAMLCNRLGLYNQGTAARAIGFTPFKDL